MPKRQKIFFQNSTATDDLFFDMLETTKCEAFLSVTWSVLNSISFIPMFWALKSHVKPEDSQPFVKCSQSLAVIAFEWENTYFILLNTEMKMQAKRLVHTT